jgi:outer membrane protein assembly factor BamA
MWASCVAETPRGRSVEIDADGHHFDSQGPQAKALATRRRPRLKGNKTKVIIRASHNAVICNLFSYGVIHDVRSWLKYRWFLNLSRKLIWLCLSVVICPWVHSQTSDPGTGQTQKPAQWMTQLSSYEGQNVSSIEIAGRPDLSLSQFVPFFKQKTSEPFSIEKVDQTAVALKTSGKFQEVRVQVVPDPNGLRVLFILEPAVYFGIFQFPGAERFTYSRLLQVANYPIQTAFNANDVEQDRQNLVTFFRQQGYFLATVDREIKVDSGNEIANVIFRVALGVRAKFGSIDIEGAPADDAAQLRAKLATFVARARGAAIRPGKTYSRGRLTRAAQYLQSILQKQGYLGAQVKPGGAEYHADTNRADIRFAVSPGVLTHVDIQGARLWPWTRKSLLPVYQGIGADDESVHEGEQALLSYFQAKGFFNVKVDSQLETGETSETVVYRISKGDKHKVTSVQLAGNTQLPASMLTPQISVQKKRRFSSGKFSDQLLRSSVKNLEAVYQSEGFSSVKVEPTVVNNGGDIQVTFRVTEGPRDIVNSIAIEGANSFPQSQFAPDGLKLAAGLPYSQAHAMADRASIIARYLKAGYLNATLRETASEVAKNEPHRIDVVYHIYEGPRVFAGDKITLGRERTRQKLIDIDTSAIKPDSPLTELNLLTAGSKLYDRTGVFDWAEVDPKRDITTQTKEDVLVKVHEAKRNDFTYGIGFEIIKRGGSVPSGTVAIPGLPPVGLPSNFTTNEVTYYGPRGSILYTRNNLRGKGESLSLTAFAGRLDQRGAFYYILPHVRWSSWGATASFSVEHNEENPIYSSQEEIGSLQVQRPLDNLKHDILFLRYSFSKTDLTHLLIPDLVPPEDQHVRLSTVAANLTRDTRDNALDEHKGVLQSIELDVNPKIFGSTAGFAKLTGQAAYYKQAFHNIVWANSIRIGLAQPFTDSFVPLSEAFFTGGSNSLRGFPLDGAGPQRQVKVCSTGSSIECSFIQVPSGGNQLLLLNSEARIPIPLKKGLGIVAFYDGGNVFPIIGFHDFTSLYSNNVGLGLRYSTPVGPVRVDFGRNLNPVPGISPNQYFITIGQAF